MTSLPPLDGITSQPGLGKFNGFLTSKSYIEGYTPSQADVKVFEAFKGSEPDAKSATHAYRWFKHISSFTEAERKAFPQPTESEAKLEAKTSSAPSTTAEKDPFADDDDLFADDDGAAAKALQEKLHKEAQDRAKQKMKNARSLIVLEVKPYEADYDLEQLAQGIKKFEHEGIQNWGAEHKLQPVAYGIKKLLISVVVYDDLICVDDIADMINEKYEEHVQSIDVQAMSKV